MQNIITQNVFAIIARVKISHFVSNKLCNEFNYHKGKNSTLILLLSVTFITESILFRASSPLGDL